jgi:iron(III) transport system permease protein
VGRGGEHRGLRALGLLTLALALTPLLSLLWQGAALWDPAGGAAALWQGATWAAVGRSVALSGVVAALCVALSVPLAWLTHCTDLPARRAFQVLLNLPLAVPSYVSAFVVMAAISQGGWLHALLRPLGVAQMPDLRGGVGATLALLYAYPLALISTQAALARLDPRLWEAARALGCSPRAAFARVILPSLRPALASGAVLVGLYTLGDFGAVALMRYKCLSYIIYLRQSSISDLLQHEAVYLSLLLVALAVGLAALLQRLGGGVSASLSSQAGFRRWPVVALGRWRWPAAALCGVVVGFGLLVPLAVLVFWIARGVEAGHSFAAPWRELWISALLAGLAATGAAVAAVAPALLGRFGGPGGARVVSWGVLTGYALPGIVVALALVSVVSQRAFWLYQTTKLLVLAYVIRFLPMALGALREALEAQNPRIYDAARVLGDGPVRAWRRAVLPGAKAALWAGWAAVFIAVLKELPLTLLLGPIELEAPWLSEPARFGTLATRIWSLTEDEYFSQVAPLVLVLLLIAGLGLALRPDTRRGGGR